MGRAKAAVGILLASTLLAVGLVLCVGQPDEVEQLLRESGPVHSEFVGPPKLGEPYIWIWTSLPGQKLKSSRVYRELRHRGWQCDFGMSGRGEDQAELYRGAAYPHDSVNLEDHPDGLQVIYYRPPTPAEKAVHALKSFLHIPD